MFEFFNDKTVRDTIFPKTSGYDFHYVIPDGELANANALMQASLLYIENNLGDRGYLINHVLCDTPVGPWQKPMWFIEVSTVDRLVDANNSSATNDDKTKPLFSFMKDVAKFISEYISKTDNNGTFLVHANVWPDQSNMTYERALHFDHSWSVCGPKISFNDIWKGPNGLIEMQAYIKESLAEQKPEKQIQEEFIRHYRLTTSLDDEQLTRYALMLIDAQHHLDSQQEAHESLLELN